MAAAAIRDQANADPTTRCRRCGLTHEEAAQRWGTQAAAWTAGHINDGQVDGPLVAEHARCNYSAGATAGNRRRRGLRTTR